MTMKMRRIWVWMCPNPKCEWVINEEEYLFTNNPSNIPCPHCHMTYLSEFQTRNIPYEDNETREG